MSKGKLKFEYIGAKDVANILKESGLTDITEDMVNKLYTKFKRYKPVLNNILKSGKVDDKDLKQISFSLNLKTGTGSTGGTSDGSVSTGRDKKSSSIKRINVGYIQVKEDIDWEDVFKAGKKLGMKKRKNPKLYKDVGGISGKSEDGYSYVFKMISEDAFTRGYVEAIRLQVCELGSSVVKDGLKKQDIIKDAETILKKLAKELGGKYTRV